MRTFIVKAEWDAEASVWVASSDDVPGLVAEDATRQGLVEKLRILIPELLELNGYPDDDDAQTEIPFELVAHSVMKDVARRHRM